MLKNKATFAIAGVMTLVGALGGTALISNAQSSTTTNTPAVVTSTVTEGATDKGHGNGQHDQVGGWHSNTVTSTGYSHSDGGTHAGKWQHGGDHKEANHTHRDSMSEDSAAHGTYHGQISR